MQQVSKKGLQTLTLMTVIERKLQL